MRLQRVSLCCLPLLLAVPVAGAQAPMSMPMGERARADDTRPVPLVAGLGNAHHAIRTTSPEAQRYFNQGMDYLFAFNHDEARRSFQKAASLDPLAAMPLWGVALAVGPNYNDIDIGHAREQEAFTALAKGRQLAAAGPAIEAAYIEALATRYAEDTHHDLHIQGQRYAKAMGALVARYPDDLDAATLYAEAMMDLHPWQLWSADGKPNEDTERIVATLQSVLRRDPSHIGANHFLIHAVEASNDPAVALASAKRLETLAPAAGHLVHMPAHILQRVGDFNGSAIANQRAVEADRAYFQAQHLEGVATMYDGMYYSHNMHFLASACGMEGNAPCAEKAARELVEHIVPEVATNRQLEWYLPTQPWVRVRFGEWATILAAAPPPAGLPVLAAMNHYARGSAYVATRQFAKAAAERGALAMAVRDLSPAIPADFNNSAKAALGLALTVLDARMLEARGDSGGAIALYEKAVAALDGFAYNEPADWYYPVRESLGGALLRAGRPAEAEGVFRRDLEQNAGNGRSLFGLWKSLAMQHREADASAVKVQFEAAWSHATVTLDVASL